MSTILYNEVRPYQFEYDDYSLAVRNAHSKIHITMVMQKPIFHTSSLPETYLILKSYLPRVLKSLCFNDSGLPFDMEVKNTEIGHLFEHILLENLCEIKVKNGHNKVSFKGVTNWNWQVDLRGTFHIQVEIEPDDIEYFQEALEKSVSLLNKILVSENRFEN